MTIKKRFGSLEKTMCVSAGGRGRRGEGEQGLETKHWDYTDILIAFH